MESPAPSRSPLPSRPCIAEVSTQAFEENYRFLSRLAAPDVELLAVVKADAYGHSLALCAPAAVRAGARWLGVTSVEEGIAARRYCSGARILLMSGLFRGQGGAAMEHRLTPVAWEPWHLEEIAAAARAAGALPASIAVHLEVDTGMSRQGVNPAGLGPLFPYFAPGSPLRLEAVMTHLFASDEADGRVTAAQLATLEEALERISSAGLFAEWLSVGSSATLLAGQAPILAELAGRHGMKALLRPGIALYGVVPRFDPGFMDEEPESLVRARAALRPVLRWRSEVVSVRAVPAGVVVGYNGTFVATEPMRLALIAAGYADGLVRSLGNRFSLLVRGQRAPLVGRVSMDQAVLDVTEIPGVQPGDEVVLLGKQGGEEITAYDHAAASGTIPWEVFTRIGPRVPRFAV